MLWETYLLYLAAVVAFFATPPDTSQLLVMSNGIRHGCRAGWTIMGDLSANALQMAAAAFGLAALIATSAHAFAAIKWLGVAYLVWVGVQTFRSAPKALEVGGRTHTSASSLFRQGFVTSSANPYAVVFFAALFPQFIDPSAPTLPQVAILGATYLVVDGLVLVLWGRLAALSLGRVKALSMRGVNRLCGLLMIAAAGLLAFKDFDPGPAVRR